MACVFGSFSQLLRFLSVVIVPINLGLGVSDWFGSGGHDHRQGGNGRSFLGLRRRDGHQHEPHSRLRLHRLPNQRMRAECP